MSFQYIRNFYDKFVKQQDNIFNLVDLNFGSEKYSPDPIWEIVELCRQIRRDRIDIVFNKSKKLRDLIYERLEDKTIRAKCENEIARLSDIRGYDYFIDSIDLNSYRLLNARAIAFFEKYLERFNQSDWGYFDSDIEKSMSVLNNIFDALDDGNNDILPALKDLDELLGSSSSFFGSLFFNIIDIDVSGDHDQLALFYRLEYKHIFDDIMKYLNNDERERLECLYIKYWVYEATYDGLGGKRIFYTRLYRKMNSHIKFESKKGQYIKQEIEKNIVESESIEKKISSKEKEKYYVKGLAEQCMSFDIVNLNFYSLDDIYTAKSSVNYITGDWKTACVLHSNPKFIALFLAFLSMVFIGTAANNEIGWIVGAVAGYFLVSTVVVKYDRYEEYANLFLTVTNIELLYKALELEKFKKPDIKNELEVFQGILRGEYNKKEWR